MPPEIEKYRRHLDGFDLSDGQKDTHLLALFGVMESFADRAFGLDAVQLVLGHSDAKDETATGPVIEFERATPKDDRLTPIFQLKSKDVKGDANE